ncbi:MAG: HAD hydrolase-like protein [bacterium]
MNSSKTILLFDIDGTLLISGGAGNRALNRAFQEKYGIKKVMESIRPDGKTDPAIVREVFREKLHREPEAAEIEELKDIYLRYLVTEVETSPSYRLLPGILPLLEHGRRISGLFLGLLTGNWEEGASIKLTRSNLKQFFPFGGFGSDAEDRGEIAKLAVDRGREYAGECVPPERIFVIGDTPHDIRCARTAGVRVIAVATGSTPLGDLACCEPDYLMPNLLNQEQFWALISK